MIQICQDVYWKKELPAYNIPMKKDSSKTCPVCGGIGRVSFFKGVSRFLLSTEECQECAGTGCQLESEKDQREKQKPTKKKVKKN